jgi:hypothetical protein
LIPIFYHKGTAQHPVGVDANSCACGHCGRLGPFSIVCRYTYIGFAFIFDRVLEKSIWLLCAGCGHGRECSRDALGARFPGYGIPFLRRFGAVLLLALTAAAWGGGYLLGYGHRGGSGFVIALLGLGFAEHILLVRDGRKAHR